MPIVIGSDLQSGTASAAYQILVSKEHHTIAHYAPEVDPKTSEQCYTAVQEQFDRQKSKELLKPLVNQLESAYMKCTYSHGQHTSRADTCHSNHSHGMFDHLIYNPEKLRINELLEIPL